MRSSHGEIFASSVHASWTGLLAIGAVCWLCVHPHSTVCLCWQVRLNESQSKNKLYFGNLPRGYTQKQLEDELKKAVKGEL